MKMNGYKSVYEACRMCDGEGGWWHDENPNVWIVCPKCKGSKRQ